MKRLLLIIFVSLMLATLTTPALANNNITVLVNNKTVDFPDEQPYIDLNNRTLVPVRFVSQALGAQVEWTPETQTVTITQSGRNVTLKIGENRAIVNGQTKTFDSKAVISKQGRTMVPLRFVSEVLGAQVEWLAKTRTVKITVNNGYTLPSKTDLKVEVYPKEDNPNKVDVSLLVLTYKDLDPQYQDVYNILSSKFGEKIAQQVVNYVKEKKNRRDNLPDKSWFANNQEINVGSNTGNQAISILIYLPGA